MSSQLLNEEIEFNSFFPLGEINRTLSGQSFGHGAMSDRVISQL